MNNLFFVLLSLSLSGSILALLLLLLRPLTKKWLSRSWQYYIWLLVLLRFLLPITPQVSIVGELTRSFERVAAIEELDFAGEGDSARMQPWEEPEGAGRNQLLPPGESTAKVSGGKLMISRYMWILWLGVALVAISFKAATYRSFARFVKAGATEIKTGRLYHLFQDELAMRNIKRAVPLYMNDLISTPMLVGLLRPAVILPPLAAGDDELLYILQHELTHYKRLDYLYKWLAQLVLCLHWFNPMAYLVVRQINKACELSCDEAVVKGLDAAGRTGYGNALIASLKAQGSYRSSVASLTMSENANMIKERLDAILSYRRKTMPVRILAAALIAVLFSGFVFAGAYTAAPQIGTGTWQNSGIVVNNSQSEGDNRMPGTRRMPDDVKTVTAKGAKPLAQHANIAITIDDDAAVDLVPTKAGEISVDYGDGLYQVSIENQGEDWRVHISYVGDYSVYPAAILYLPDIVYGNVDVQAEEATVYFSGVFQQGAAINASMESCSVFYTIPNGFKGTLNAALPSCYIELYAEDEYQSCNVTIANCMAFGNIADGFLKQGNGLVNSGSTGDGVAYIDMKYSGYASIESGSYASRASARGTGS